ISVLPRCKNSARWLFSWRRTLLRPSPALHCPSTAVGQHIEPRAMLQVLNRELAATQETQPAPAYSSAAKPQQVVLVFQGGGALGAYQAGVYQALHEAGVEPDWIIGTSIGAINASLI